MTCYLAVDVKVKSVMMAYFEWWQQQIRKQISIKYFFLLWFSQAVIGAAANEALPQQRSKPFVIGAAGSDSRFESRPNPSSPPRGDDNAVVIGVVRGTPSNAAAPSSKFELHPNFRSLSSSASERSGKCSVPQTRDCDPLQGHWFSEKGCQSLNSAAKWCFCEIFLSFNTNFLW